MKNKLLTLTSWLFCTCIVAQESTISGYVRDNSSGEILIGANVFDQISKKGTTSNNYGFYSLSLANQEAKLSISYVGYETRQLTIVVTKDTFINIDLSNNIDLEEVVISDRYAERIEEKSQMSTIAVPIQQIKNVPALLGEVDVLKALQLLPGVQSGGEGQSGLYVRGGSPDQNLILLDGVPVYNASHLFGFFSVFNADAIKDVKLIKGGFPARYGGRLSSVLEINMKEGNNQKIHGSASVGLVASKFTLEGPIAKRKTSFIVSGRRTYIDVLARPFIQDQYENEGLEGGTGYYFYDINGKVNHIFSDRDKLFLSFYKGKDVFYLDQKDLTGPIIDFNNQDLGWGNLTAALRWNHVWNPKLFSNLSLTFTDYNLDVGIQSGTDNQLDNSFQEVSLDYLSGIVDYTLKLDFDYSPSHQHFIRFGGQGILHNFAPGEFTLFSEQPDEGVVFNTRVGQAQIKATEWGVYAEDDWKMSDKLKTNLGIHFSGFHAQSSSYYSIQPRISMRYLLAPDLSTKVSFASMRQYVQLLAFEGAGLPTDLWLPTTDQVRPQDSWQIALGLSKSFSDNYEISIEGYFKKMRNLLSYRNGESIFDISPWEQRVTQGDGESYGGELFLQKKYGRFSGWLGYTLSWTTRQFSDLNRGLSFPFRYDRRHDVSIVGIYRLHNRWQLSGTWVYGTGNAISLANAQYRSRYGRNGFIGETFPTRNNYRMRNYHRLDIGINWIKETDSYTRTWSFGFYNTYARQNPFYVYLDEDSIFTPQGQEVKTTLKQVSLFPIIPYFNYKFEF